MTNVGSGSLTVRIDADGAVALVPGTWPGFALAGLRPALWVDGAAAALEDVAVRAEADGGATVTARFAGSLQLTLAFAPAPDGAVGLRATLHNEGSGDRELNDVAFLGLPEGGGAALGTRGARVVLLEQGNYWGRVRRLVEPPETSRPQGEPDGAAPRIAGASDNVWVAWDPVARRALVAGFLTSERWLGRVEVEADAAGRVRRWRLGHDGADVRLPAGAQVALEEAILVVGDDPWRLLEEYGDRVAARHGVAVRGPVPVSWCSWYPYRLGVTEERILETARLAAERLRPLGLSVVEIDLGWQAGNLPSTFDENERFPRGLRWLADRLAALGLQLGVWSAPYSISQLDPMAAAHPEYLIPGDDGRPAVSGTWFWEPHGKVHILDLTSPGARQWLRQRLEGLAAKGVRYLKPDFIGCVAHPAARRRGDRAIASGGGTEAGRLGAILMRQALPEATILNCGGPEMPGTGALPLLYTCNDTGNTGFLATDFRRRNTQALACHLWKNRRWGILQPSCLAVGLPGTVEDARLRATIAFLAGGQVDIADTLQTLPEDRWAILTATLPPLGLSARPVDLFDPLPAVPFDYEGSTRGNGGPQEPLPELPAGSVWHLRVATTWDAWDLVGVLNFAVDADAPAPKITRFAIPFQRLGLSADGAREGFEFWSCQYLGTVPGRRRNPGGYTHPGDFQDLLSGDAPGTLDLAFFGPAAKLICLRARRPHPWVAGTSFHQSCGAELDDVTWDEDRGALSGALRRPPGESGALVLTAAGRAVADAEVGGRAAAVRRGANGSLVVPIATRAAATRWRVRFA